MDYNDAMWVCGAGELAEELAAFEQYRKELCALCLGRYVLMKGRMLLGVFDGEMDAVTAGYERLGNVPFLVKKVALVDTPIWMPVL